MRENEKKIEFPDSSHHWVIHVRLLFTSERRKKRVREANAEHLIAFNHLLCDDAVLFREIVFHY